MAVARSSLMNASKSLSISCRSKIKHEPWRIARRRGRQTSSNVRRFTPTYSMACE